MMRDTDTLGPLYSDGLDLHRRRVILHGDIDEESAAKAMRGLMYLDDSPGTIEFWISSYGGDIEEAFGLHDFIDRMDNRIECHAFGKCMSAAPLLLLAGSYATASHHCQFMLHALSVEGMGPSGSRRMADTAAATSFRTAQYIELLDESTGRDASTWEGMFSSATDTYFTSYEAKRLGLIDGIRYGN